MALSVPYIDPSVEHVGISRLRKLNATRLRNFEKTLVIQDNDTPLAVLLKYEQFLTMQQQLRSVLDTVEVLTDRDEVAGLVQGLGEIAAGRTRTLDRIRRDLKKRKEK